MLGQVVFRFIPFQLVEILEQSMKQKDRMRFLQCPLGFHHLSPLVFGDRSSELGSGQVPTERAQPMPTELKALEENMRMAFETEP